MKPKLISITCDEDTIYALDDEGNIYFRKCSTEYREMRWVKLDQTKFEESTT